MLRIFFVLLVILAVSVGIMAIASFQFRRDTEERINAFFLTGIKNDQDIITASHLEGLPALVRKWMGESGVLGQERIHAVRSLKRGELRLQKEGRWMPLTAKQYFTVDSPGFIWQSRIQAFPLINISGRDYYEQGKGNMLIKLLSLITIADERGDKVDQGALVRYLAEIVWFPTAVLSDAITWEEMDEKSAKGTITQACCIWDFYFQ